MALHPAVATFDLNARLMSLLSAMCWTLQMAHHDMHMPLAVHSATCHDLSYRRVAVTPAALPPLPPRCPLPHPLPPPPGCRRRARLCGSNDTVGSLPDNLVPRSQIFVQACMQILVQTCSMRREAAPTHEALHAVQQPHHLPHHLLLQVAVLPRRRRGAARCGRVAAGLRACKSLGLCYNVCMLSSEQA